MSDWQATNELRWVNKKDKPPASVNIDTSGYRDSMEALIAMTVGRLVLQQKWVEFTGFGGIRWTRKDRHPHAEEVLPKEQWRDVPVVEEK